MIRLELGRLIRARLWRWAIGIGLSVGLGVLSWHWLGTYHARATANVWDLVLAGVSQFYVAAVILPVYYLFLVGDLAAGDREGYAALLAGRIPSRGAWWAAKVIALGVGGALVVLLVLTILVSMGFVVGLPFHLTWSLYVRHGGAYEVPRSAGLSLATVWPQGPLAAIGEWAALALGTFLSLGCNVLAVGLRLRTTLIPWLLGLVAASATYVVWMVQPTALRWMPTAQMMLLQHISRSPVRWFGTHPLWWSAGYVVIMSAMGIFGGLRQARHMSLTPEVVG